MAVSQKNLDALKASIQDMDDVALRLKLLLYGVSGVGKTVLAMDLAQKVTAPDKRILFIDTGEGWVSLENHPQLKKRTQRMVYKGLSQITILVDAIKEGAPGFDDFGTIIFDEFSTSSKQFLHLVLEANEIDKLKGAPEYKHWGILSRGLENTIWKLLELKESHHLVLITHEKVRTVKATGMDVTSTSLGDTVEGTVKENMHIVARMTAKLTNKTGKPVYVRELQVHPSKMVVAKTRVGGLDIFTPPNVLSDRVVDWMQKGGHLVDEKEIVELDTEKQVEGNFADQTEPQEFKGYEVEGE